MRRARRQRGVERVEDWHDVRMLQPRGQEDLALEPFAADAGSEIGRQHLDDHTARKRALLGDDHAAHGTAAELPFDGVCAGERSLE